MRRVKICSQYWEFFFSKSFVARTRGTLAVSRHFGRRFSFAKIYGVLEKFGRTVFIQLFLKIRKLGTRAVIRRQDRVNCRESFQQKDADWAIVPIFKPNHKIFTILGKHLSSLFVFARHFDPLTNLKNVKQLKGLRKEGFIFCIVANTCIVRDCSQPVVLFYRANRLINWTQL